MLAIGNHIISRYEKYPHSTHCTAIVIFIIVLYCKVIGHEFLINWDDVDYITQNPLIQKINVANLKQIFLSPFNGNYAPLLMLSFMGDYAIWGLNPSAFKLINVLLHATSALIFYHLMLRLGLSAVQAFIAATLFAVHPVQVETVAWASQRKSVLSMGFFLAAWFSWDVWNRADVHRKHCWYIFSLICFTSALCSKSIAVVLPFILITQEFVLNRKRITKDTITPLLPYLLLLGSFIALAIVAAKGSGGGSVPYHGGSFGITAMNMLPVFARYLLLLFMPNSLTIIYNAPLKNFPDMSILVGGLILLAFIVVWLWLGKRNPRYFFWLTIFVIGLLPVTNIVPIVTLMNDRYLYFPMLGMAPFVVLVGDDACKFLKVNKTLLPAVVTTIAVMVLSVITWKQVDVWKNSVSLWKNAIEKAPTGTWYETSDKTDYIQEGYVEALIVEATRFIAEGRVGDAQKLSLTALSYDPNNYNALGLLAEAHMQENQPLKARPYLLRLVNMYPASEAAHLYLGKNYTMTNEKELAAEQFNIVIKINPTNQRALQGLNDLTTRHFPGSP